MKLNWIEFENLETGLKIEKTIFNNELTLLVGRSGAGKTQILEAILNICMAATDVGISSEHVFKGAISFTIDEINYEWCVELDKEDLTKNPSFVNKIGSRFMNVYPSRNTNVIVKFEQLTSRSNGKKSTLFTRNGSDAKIKGFRKLPIISNDYSLIFQYRFDELFSKIYKCMSGLYKLRSVSPESESNSYWTVPISALDEYKNILMDCEDDDKYRDTFPQNFSIPTKIYLLNQTNKKLYNILLRRFKKIFPDIEDIQFETNEDTKRVSVSVMTGDTLIPYDALSAGMNKTFLFLLDILTISNNYVVLIDEIENGLGINCLNSVYNLITTVRDDLQLIITSHHPYIINHIEQNSCKIVIRKNNIISSYSANKLGKFKSRHDFYDQLINKLQYGESS